MTAQPKEPQYQVQFDTMSQKGPVRLGPTTSHLYRSDPRHLGFLLARYKFCAKLLAGKRASLEVGCGDGFGIRTVLQEVESVHGIDFDPLFVQWATEQAVDEELNCTFSVLDITQDVPAGRFDAVYALDVIEHIAPHLEKNAMDNICSALEENAVCVIGTPNSASSEYASVWSREGHINLKSAETLKSMLLEYFCNAFVFSMNDEVIHTGYYPMAHYLVGVGCGLR